MTYGNHTSYRDDIHRFVSLILGEATHAALPTIPEESGVSPVMPIKFSKVPFPELQLQSVVKVQTLRYPALNAVSLHWWLFVWCLFVWGSEQVASVLRLNCMLHLDDRYEIWTCLSAA